MSSAGGRTGGHSDQYFCVSGVGGGQEGILLSAAVRVVLGKEVILISAAVRVVLGGGQEVILISAAVR